MKRSSSNLIRGQLGTYSSGVLTDDNSFEDLEADCTLALVNIG